MQHIFIDFENVGWSALEGIEVIDVPTTIYIFGSQISPHLPLRSLAAAPSKFVKWQFVMANNGQRDSLDILLGSYVGFCIGVSENPDDDSFLIISNDKGYDSLLESWTNNGINIERRPGIKVCNPESETDENKILKTEMEFQLRKLVSEDFCDDKQIVSIANFVESCNRFCDVYRKISSVVGVRFKSEIYNSIKDFAKEYFNERNQNLESLTSSPNSEIIPQLRNYLGNDYPIEFLKDLVPIIDDNTSLSMICSKIGKYVGDVKTGSAIYKKIKPMLRLLGKK